MQLPFPHSKYFIYFTKKILNCHKIEYFHPIFVFFFHQFVNQLLWLDWFCSCFGLLKVNNQHNITFTHISWLFSVIRTEKMQFIHSNFHHLELSKFPEPENELQLPQLEFIRLWNEMMKCECFHESGRKNELCNRCNMSYFDVLID